MQANFRVATIRLEPQWLSPSTKRFNEFECHRIERPRFRSRQPRQVVGSSELCEPSPGTYLPSSHARNSSECKARARESVKPAT